jgi:UDP-N-acetylmuramoyl-tripeptide--D-alanyl-D-alanine ligase
MKQLFKKIIVALLRVESRAVLKRYNPKIVGVTGNVGKTSTKDAIFVALSPFTHVRKSEKSFNSETGVPLSVLGVPNGWSNPIQWIKNLFAGLLVIFFKGDYPKWLVLEIGADAPGDIKQLASWIKPDVALITRFPEVPVHIEYFDSKEAVIEEKKELVKALKPDGILVLNADDAVVRALADEYRQRAVTYGFGDANVHGGELSFIYQKIDGVTMPIGVETVVTIGEESYPLRIDGVLGTQQMYAALGAVAVAYALGFDVATAIAALAKDYDTPPGRLSPLLGINRSLIIDDTYNSSPAACEAALQVLKNVKAAGKKIAVIGDMLELGKYTLDAHRDIGVIASLAADTLITVGIRAKAVSEAAFAHGMKKTHIMHFADATAAGEHLKEIIKKGDIVLIKGSQGVRLERAVKAVMQFPEEANDRLVRQEEEWMKR